MSSAEYSLRLYYRDPWGDRTVATLLAQLLAMTFNIHRAREAEEMTAEDFLPSRQVAEPVRPATGADAFAFIATLEP